MAYVFSRIILILLQPLSLALVLMALAFVAGWLGLRRLRGMGLGLSFLILFVTLFTTTGSWALSKLEHYYPRPSADPASASCIIVLGGAIEAPVIAGRGGYEMNQAADRFIETLRLARLLPDAKIIVSGGDGSLSGNYEGDASVSERFLTAFGIDPARLIKETQSRTTTENVTETKALLAANNLEDRLLVTSAYHMVRATALFEKQGVIVQPWPADYRTPGDVALWFDFTQPALNAQLSYTATREWGSLLRSYLSGQTLHLLPN